MENIKKILQGYLTIEFISATLSNPRLAGGAFKVKVRPVMKKDTLFFQLETFKGKQVFHQNLQAGPACEELLHLMQEMRQLQIETKKEFCTILVSKKGKVTVKRKLRGEEAPDMDLSHNRKKRYILREGICVPFLVDLGVMTEEGKVVQAKYGKYRQINRFLEFIEDVLLELPNDREAVILDFGCGKSYLTFAMYYYLHELKGYDIRIIGLDLKADVIRRCQRLSEKYGYDKLKFLEGDIADYAGDGGVDMVVTLHACDTATDLALAKAVGWNAKVILSVPCCQHELNAQIESDVLRPLLKYGLIKERFAALLTDTLRAEYLEREGYDTQILEFIEMEHTPKNILIRAVRTGRKGKNAGEIEACERALSVSPMIGKLLG